MTNTTKNPKFYSTCLADIGTSAAPGGSISGHRLLNRSGTIYVRSSSGVEVPLASQTESNSVSKNYLQTWYNYAGGNGAADPNNSMVSISTETGTRDATAQTLWVAGEAPNGLTITFGMTYPSGGSNTYDATLRGTSCFEIAGTGTGAVAGTRFVESPTFTLDGADVGGKPVYLSFDCSSSIASGDYDVVIVRYNTSGVYQEKIPVVGRVSSCTATPSARIPTGKTNFLGYFVSGTTATDMYAVRFRRLANATSIKLDSIAVFPKQLGMGTFTSGWSEAEATTIVSTGGGLAKAATKPVDSVRYRYVTENTIQVLVNYRQTGVGTAGAGVYALKLPNNFTFDTSYMRPSIFTGIVANDDGYPIGNATIGNSSTSWQGGVYGAVDILSNATFQYVSVKIQNYAAASIAAIPQAWSTTYGGFGNTDLRISMMFTAVII